MSDLSSQPAVVTAFLQRKTWWITVAGPRWVGFTSLMLLSPSRTLYMFSLSLSPSLSLAVCVRAWFAITRRSHLLTDTYAPTHARTRTHKCGVPAVSSEQLSMGLQQLYPVFEVRQRGWGRIGVATGLGAGGYQAGALGVIDRGRKELALPLCCVPKLDKSHLSFSLSHLSHTPSSTPAETKQTKNAAKFPLFSRLY